MQTQLEGHLLTKAPVPDGLISGSYRHQQPLLMGPNYHISEMFILVKTTTLFPQSYQSSFFYCRQFTSCFWEEDTLEGRYWSVFTRQLDISDKLNMQLHHPWCVNLEAMLSSDTTFHLIQASKPSFADGKPRLVSPQLFWWNAKVYPDIFFRPSGTGTRISTGLSARMSRKRNYSPLRFTTLRCSANPLGAVSTKQWRLMCPWAFTFRQ